MTSTAGLKVPSHLCGIKFHTNSRHPTWNHMAHTLRLIVLFIFPVVARRRNTKRRSCTAPTGYRSSCICVDSTTRRTMYLGYKGGRSGGTRKTNGTKARRSMFGGKDVIRFSTGLLGVCFHFLRELSGENASCEIATGGWY